MARPGAGAPAPSGAGTGQPAVEFRDIDIAYGKFVAVRDFSLSIAKGSFVTLLGPSGCGKTTILRSIAGLVDISGGQIMIDGRRVDDVPIYKRNIGLVFQSYALFPHKNVFDNVAFGLKYRNVPKPEIVRKVPGARNGAAAGQREEAAVAAVGRAAAAHRACPRHRLRAAGAAARRAAVGAGREHARGDARRDQEDPEGNRHHRHLRHPRPGGSALHVGSHRGDERRRCGADRNPAGGL
ncbi:ATP-binding protein of spermidine/putrescine ABC transporter [Mesorhizobium japonicum MAFF 303099]|uniref:ATP-binding protein of spermidine/putrescine ABC transporter n=1 Tax=Mesorhizobium japonicum (strain LMG 29417 / CECT 9101 / MAFF 303099) TaxID=266835 RepID=Q98JA9_RHILO|nr:ATP-binding protein of spermidine/putrescine ABC transporter [Mesorhizobium japonicum MAFF 303099]